MHESEKWKWSRSVVSDSSRPHGLQPTRLLRPWDFLGKSTGVGCHCLLLNSSIHQTKICCCSVTKSRPTLRHGLQHTRFPCPLHYLPEFAQTHVHWVDEANQLSHYLSPASPPALNLSRHHGLFQWVGSLHQVANVLELQFQHQSFQWIFMVDFLWE